jgi:hypothetical protein
VQRGWPLYVVYECTEGAIVDPVDGSSGHESTNRFHFELTPLDLHGPPSPAPKPKACDLQPVPCEHVGYGSHAGDHASFLLASDSEEVMRSWINRLSAGFAYLNTPAAIGRH